MSRDGTQLFVATDKSGTLVSNWQAAKPDFKIIQPQTVPGRSSAIRPVVRIFRRTDG